MAFSAVDVPQKLAASVGGEWDGQGRAINRGVTVGTVVFESSAQAHMTSNERTMSEVGGHDRLVSRTVGHVARATSFPLADLFFSFFFGDAITLLHGTF